MTSEFLSKHKWPLAVFAAAFLIRLFYLIEISINNPAFYHPMVDELWHLNWANDILHNSFWGETAYFRGPLYPYFLAVLLKISGGSLFFARLVQALISACSAALVYLIGRKSFSHKVGLVSGFVYALYGTLMFYEAMLLIPVIFIFLNLLGLYLVMKLRGRYNIKKWMIAGIIIGLAAIARPNVLLIIPLILIWIYLGFKEIKEFKKRLIIPAVYLAGILIPVFSVTLRNIIVTGEPILISSQGGINLYIGNNPDTEGLTMLMPEIDINEALPWTEFTTATREAAEREAGHSLTPGEESSFWTKKALKFIFGNPGKFIEITFKKLIYFLTGFENPDQTDIYQAREYSIIFSILLWKSFIYFPYGLLVPLAILGSIFFWRNNPDISLMHFFIIGYIPTVILFLVTARHRLPVIPFMIILAVGAVYYMIERFKQKDNRVIYTSVIVGIILLIGCNRTYFDVGFENEFQTYFNLGLTYNRQGNLPKAEEEYKKAVSINPYSATTWNNLGYVQYQLGKLNDAMESYRKAIESDPKFPDTYNNVGLVYEARQDYVNAEKSYRKALELDPQIYQSHFNLGDVYIAQGDMARAETEYKTAMEIAPDAKETHFKLAALYARMKRFAEAEQLFISGKALGQPSGPDYINWGNIYYSSDRPQKALEKYRSAIISDPQLIQAYFNMAITFDRYHLSVDSTRAYLNQALKLDPNFRPARELQSKLNSGR